PVADTLAATVPTARAPAALRERILAAVHAEAGLLQAAGHEADQPARPAGRRRARRSAAVRASVALAVGAAAATVIALSVRSSTRERVSTGQVAASAPGARATVRQLGTRAELVVSGMPQPPPGRIYEVWLRRATGSPQPTDALFGVTSRGSGAASVPGIGRGVREVLVTSEPLGGSAQPTSAPVIRIPLRSWEGAGAAAARAPRAAQTPAPRPPRALPDARGTPSGSRSGRRERDRHVAGFDRERAVARPVVGRVTTQQLQLHRVPGREFVAVAV